MPNTKTRSEAAVLVIVVFFLGALLGVVGNHLWGESVWGKQISAAHPTRDQLVSSLTHDLQLNAEQQQQLGAIIDDTKAQIRAVYAPADAQREVLRPRGDELPLRFYQRIGWRVEHGRWVIAGERMPLVTKCVRNGLALGARPHALRAAAL